MKKKKGKDNDAPQSQQDQELQRRLSFKKSKDNFWIDFNLNIEEERSKIIPVDDAQAVSVELSDQKFAHLHLLPLNLQYDTSCLFKTQLIRLNHHSQKIEPERNPDEEDEENQNLGCYDDDYNDANEQDAEAIAEEFNGFDPIKSLLMKQQKVNSRPNRPRIPIIALDCLINEMVGQ